MWNHRVIRHVKDDGDEWFGIHEVYYYGNNDEKPHSCTVEPILIAGEELEGIKWTVDKIMKCLDKPVIDYSYFENLKMDALKREAEDE